MLTKKKTTIILIFIKTQSMTKETNAKKAQKMLSSYELWKFPFETFLKLEVKWLMQDIPLSLMILYDIVYCTIKGPKLLIDWQNGWPENMTLTTLDLRPIIKWEKRGL